MPANDAHRVTWCRIRKLRANSGADTIHRRNEGNGIRSADNLLGSRIIIIKTLPSSVLGIRSQRLHPPPAARPPGPHPPAPRWPMTGYPAVGGGSRGGGKEGWVMGRSKAGITSRGLRVAASTRRTLTCPRVRAQVNTNPPTLLTASVACISSSSVPSGVSQNMSSGVPHSVTYTS
jgi:hypothetical protein